MGTAEPIIQILCVRSCKWLGTFIQRGTEWFKGNVTFVSTTSNVSLVARQASNISTLSVYVGLETCPQGDRLVGGFPFHACGRIRMRAKDATSASIANDENSLCWRCRMAILGKITRWHASRCTGSRTMTATRSRSLWEFRFLSVHVPTIRLNYEGVAWIPKFISPRFYPWTIAWWIIPRDRAWASFQINYSKDDHLSNTLSCLARNCYFERIIHWFIGTSKRLVHCIILSLTYDQLSNET